MSADEHDAPPPGPDAAAAPIASQASPPADDVVLVHSRSEDGKGLNVIRKQGDALRAGQVRPVEEGKPLAGDLISLRPREESPALFNVVTHYRKPDRDGAEAAESGPTSQKRPRSGPAQVSTEGYRAGWNSIWGKKKPQKATLN